MPTCDNCGGRMQVQDDDSCIALTAVLPLDPNGLSGRTSHLTQPGKRYRERLSNGYLY